MDYGKSGSAKTAGKQPKHKVGMKGLGAEKSPTGGRPSKDEVLAKMKAVAAEKKQG